METNVKDVVVVTGAASGIGLATATALAETGADVIAVDRDSDGLARLAAMPRSSGTVAVVTCDLADEGQRADLIAQVDRVTGLVNAAGIIRLTPINMVTVEEWRLVQQVNAEAAFFLMQGLSEKIHDGGSIVNLASTAAKTGSTTEAASYAASKAALISMTRAFAHHLAARRITVNAICPGVIDTPMQDDVLRGLAVARQAPLEQIEAARGATVPLGRAGTPQEVAWLIRWLLGPESRYLTGQAVNICGGLVTW